MSDMRSVCSTISQLVDKDAATDEWGLAEDIDSSVRGEVPSSPKTLLKRLEDELIRLAIAAGVERTVVADSFDVGYRTTWRKERRAHAFQLPLSTLYGEADSERVEAAADAADRPLEHRLGTDR